MPQGQSVPEVVQWIVVWLRTVMACWDISMYTDLSELKVHEILAYFNTTGGVNVPRCQRPNLHRSLGEDSIKVRPQFDTFSLLSF